MLAVAPEKIDSINMNIIEIGIKILIIIPPYHLILHINYLNILLK